MGLKASRMDEGDAALPCQQLTEKLFLRHEWQRRCHSTIRELLKAIPFTSDFKQLLECAVVRIEIGMSDGPVLAVPILISAFEFVVREPQSDASPGETAAANLPALRPQKGLIIRCAVGVLALICVQVGILFPVAGVSGLTSVASAEQPLGSFDAVARFSAEGFSDRSIGTCFHNQNPESCFSEGHCGHPACGT